MSSVRFDPDNALTCDGGGRAEVEDPDQPERIGPLAAKYLDHLAAQQADPDLAARQAEALNRLRRPLTKEQQP